ncbi:MFS transporter [Nocardioides sp. 1609]|uniref:MFS transporter n=1 Tax=Nocardioides sp. 1609 TaxID=2508327 RepID=UPI00106FFE1B|nr:MFS transporter [Nocardioides sp. 1609]
MGAFVLLLGSMAVGFYCPPVYLAELPASSNVSATEAALGTTIFLLLTSALSPAVAAGLRRWGLLPILLVGGGTGAASLASLGLAQDSTTAFLAYAGLALGTACAGLVPATAAIVEAPSVKRALVVGTLGMPIGGLVIAPVAGAAVDSIGFAAVCDMLAAFSGITVLIAAALLTPHGRARPGMTRSAEAATATSPESVLTSGVFWRTFAVVSLILLTQNSALTTIVAVGVDREIPAATLAITVVAGISIAGRLAALPFVSAISPVAFGAGIALVHGTRRPLDSTDSTGHPVRRTWKGGPCRRTVQPRTRAARAPWCSRC